MEDGRGQTNFNKFSIEYIVSVVSIRANIFNIWINKNKKCIFQTEGFSLIAALLLKAQNKSTLEGFPNDWINFFQQTNPDLY